MKSPRNKVLVLIITVLLLSNLALVGFMLWGKKDEKKPSERGKSFSDYFEKQLSFTPEQVTKFHQLRDEHLENIRSYLKEVRLAKDSLFKLMRSPNVADSIIVKASDNLAQKEKEQELQSFRHFSRVREMCTEEQRVKFDSLMDKIINRSFTRGQNRTPPKDGGDKKPK